MKRIDFKATAALLTAGLAVGYAEADLIGHWTLDESPAPNATTVADSSGATVHDGTLTSTQANASVVGQIGTAFNFVNINTSNPAAQTYITADLGSDIVDDANPATVTLWINPDSISGTQQFLFAWGANVAGRNARLTIESKNGDTVLRYRHQGGFVEYDASSITTSSGWHHIAYVIPDSATNVGNVLVYVDGVLANVLVSDNDTLDINPFDTSFFIGSNFGGNAGFNGQIDDVGYWNEALTTDEITAIYQGGLQGNDLQASIPEPSSLALVGLGGLCLIRRRRSL